MKIEKKFENGTLEISLFGHIDANNAPEFETLVSKDVGQASKVIINAKELEYISSAGLRVILKIRKLVPDTSIIEASSEAYEIFEMTGFTEMMPVSKKFRELDVTGCKVIGRGYYGTVYRISKDTIVKVYSEKMTLDRIYTERDLAKKAFVLGVPTAIPYDVVKVDGKYGSVFELIDAETLQEKMLNNVKDIDTYVKQSIDALKIIHSSHAKPGELHDIKKEVLEWTNAIQTMVPEKTGKRLLELVNGIEESTTILHGDYHIKNIMMVGDEPFIIDMDTLCMGSPIFEFGFMYSSYIGYQEIDHENGMKFFGIEHEYLVQFFNKSIDLYFADKSPLEREIIYKKARILCYIQLIFRFDKYQDHPELLERFKSLIGQLVLEVDDLNI